MWVPELAGAADCALTTGCALETAAWPDPEE